MSRQCLVRLRPPSPTFLAEGGKGKDIMDICPSAVGVAAYAGVDTHKDTHMLGLIDSLGKKIGTWEFPATKIGYELLAKTIGNTEVPIGIEGTRSYGAGLAEYLFEAGFAVFEMIRPKREQRRRGKTDEIDAIAAARNLAAGKGVAFKRIDGAVGDIRWLMAERGHDVDNASKLITRIKSLLATAPEDIRERWGACSKADIEAMSATRRKDAASRVLHDLARDCIASEKRAEQLKGEIRLLIVATYPRLIGGLGIDAITAARIMLAAGSNPDRLKSEASFSMLAGTSPIPASSGKTNRYRLNRGGDRQLNRAIHEIARVKMAKDERTKSYIAKKLAEGKTKKEAIRCLCRFIAREIYRLLTMPQVPVADQTTLKARRKALGLSRSEVEKGAGIAAHKVRLLENLDACDDESLEKYARFLKEMETQNKVEIEN